MMDTLPSEIAIYIFSFVDQVPCRFVCQLWRDLIPVTRQSAYLKIPAADGYINLLKWAYRNGAGWDYWASVAAAKGGHIAVLRWLKKKKPTKSTNECENAAGAGQLQTLKWLHKNGHVWNDHAYYAAAKNKHRHVLEWLFEHLKNDACTRSALLGALNSGENPVDISTR